MTMGVMDRSEVKRRAFLPSKTLFMTWWKTRSMETYWAGYMTLARASSTKPSEV